MTFASCSLVSFVKDVSTLQQISNTNTASSDSQCIFTKLQRLLAVANAYTVVEHSLSKKKKGLGEANSHYY